jgi:hypothetical protein
MSGGAPDCPVCHPTEGKNCLPIGSPTAPSCLGAIKGTLRRMEQNTKDSLNILIRLDFTTMHSDHRVKDLSTVWVVNSLRRVLCSCLGLCASVCCNSSFVKIPRKREKTTKEENCGTQGWSLDHLRGIECNPWPKEVTTTWSRHWLNHGIKSPSLLCHLLCDWFLLSSSHLITCDIVP